MMTETTFENDYVIRLLEFGPGKQAVVVATATIIAFFVWLLLLPDNPAPGERTRIKIVYMQLKIRLRYTCVSWFGLKPWISPRINGHVNEDQQHAVDFGYVPKLIFKFVWAVSGFFQGFGPVGAAIPYLLGFRLVLEIIYHITHAYVVHVCKKLKPEGFMKPLKLPEYDWKNGSPEEFHEMFVKNPRPAVMRGINKDVTTELSFDKILEKYGEDDVMLTREDIAKDYLGKLKEVNDPNVYVVNCEALYNKNPEIQQQIKMDVFADYMKKKVSYFQMFVGRSGTGTPLHCASNWNFFTMLDGKKTWYFADPEHSWFIYPVAAMGRGAAFTLPAYPDEYDEQMFPLMKWLPYYKVTVEPGDLLFLPPWWWHAVRNDVSDKTVGIASRWLEDGTVGTYNQFTTEDDDVNRWLEWMFFAGPKSYSFMHNILRTPSPMYDEHITLREKNHRFIALRRLTQKMKMRF